MSEATRPPHEDASALPPGTRLGEFEVRRLLGVGGFGIVYLAFDHQLEREVAVKEYMPASMAGRTETMHVSLRSQADAEVFALGLRSFVNEARLLARFDHPSLLKVHRFWEANGTAYMAMPVLRGRTLKAIRAERSANDAPIDEAWLRAMLDPLLGALERLHAEGVYHRDIAPDNIQIEADGHPVLMDFGAARRVITDKTQTLTAILKPAYAPIEQYAEAGSVKQGPWTDLYALGATLHYMLLGQAPAPATARAVHDDEAPLAARELPGCGPSFLRVVDWMLAPRPADRPQSVAELRAALAGHTVPRGPATATAAAQAWERTQALPPRAEAPLPVAAGAPHASSPASTPGVSARPAPEPIAQPAARRGGPAWYAAAALAAAAVAAFVLWPRGDGASGVASSPATPSVGTPSSSAAIGASPPAPAGSAIVPAIVPATAALSSLPTAPAAASAAGSVAAGAPSSAARAGVATPVQPAARPATPRAVAPAASRAAPARLAVERAVPPGPSTGARPEPQGAVVSEPAVVVPPAERTPPPAAAVPAPGPTAAPGTSESAAPAGPTGPEARCAGRRAIAHFVCMERQCLRSELASHPDCQKWRKEARPRE